MGKPLPGVSQLQSRWDFFIERIGLAASLARIGMKILANPNLLLCCDESLMFALVYNKRVYILLPWVCMKPGSMEKSLAIR
jgi:hypothetical protein